MAIKEGDFVTRISREERYRFRIDFASKKVGPLLMDEPEPLGTGRYPNAGSLLAAAVGNCLCASFVFCMEKARGDIVDICAEVETTLERNERNRLRVKHITVKMFPQAEAGPKFDRCREIFEDFCIVTQSVKEGIDVDVEVFPVRPLDEAGEK
jgi:uncharacterized OsmC-like protein